MNNKSIIFLIVLAALVLGYFIFFYTDIEFELRDEFVSVNINDTVNLKNYVLIAKDSKTKNLMNKIKITVEKGEDDEFSSPTLVVGDFSVKKVTYTLKYKFKTITKSLEIMVISDPSDPNFRPNEYKGGKANEDDIPNTQVNDNLTNSQKEYLESLLK